MSKREARIARQALKALKNSEKSARQVQQIAEADAVRLEALPVAKEPRLGANPASIFSMSMSWTCDAPDKEGAWSWGVERCWSDGDWEQTILPKLNAFAGLTWGELDGMSSDTGHKMHHNMEVEQICDEAQARLITIDQAGETIFRFRMSNKQRLWGFRTLAVFEVLWFDPTHQIYPVDG